MYNSPIELIVDEITHQIVKQKDENIYQAVLSYIPNVDKEELLRALQYDRNQYEKGYMDGKADAAQRWIPVSERLPEQYESVIVWTSDREIGEAEYDGKQFYWTSDDNYTNATHWMPLPEPPKEENK